MELTLAHVSDFHASGSWFDEQAFEAGVRRVNDMDVDHVIFTGDLTDYGTADELERTAHLLDRFEAPVSCVMGNHDAMREGWRLFADRLMGGRRYYAQAWRGVNFVGLDSAEPDIHEGHIGREQMEWFEQIMRDANPAPTVVALHHHVIPVPFTGRERNILLDSGELLRVLDEHRVPLVLTGHKHQPWAWRVNDTVIATTGTFCSRKTNCGQSFNRIDMRGGELTVTNVEVPSGARRKLGHWALPTLPVEVSA